MARRKQSGAVAAESVPERLCRFVAAEWPGGDAMGEWKAARRSWLGQHGDETVLGDFVDLLTVEVETKRRLAQ